MKRSIVPTYCLVLLCLPAWANAQSNDRMKVITSLEPKEAAPGEVVTFKLHYEVVPGFHTYPTVQADPNAGDYVTKFKIKAGPLESAGAVKEPKPVESFDPDLKATVGHLEGTGDFEVPYKVKAGTAAGTVKVSVRVDTQVCSTTCVPFIETYDFELKVKAPGGANPPETVKQPNVPTKQQETPPVVVPTKLKGSPAISSKPAEAPNADVKKPVIAGTDVTLLSILIQAAGLGFLALLTPCVFPMIPITVSYFLKQKEGTNALRHSFVYTGTIIISLAIFIYAFVDLAQKLNYHWATNLFLGLLLMVFAISLFGMFEIRLPTALSNWTSAGQDRGGYLGTIFMALTFMIISFSCVSPIVGVMAGLSAEKRPFLWNVLTALVFATCFALPFFVLSLFPTMLKKLPKSGGWLNSLKVILGLLEVAAALKFFRQSEINFKGNKVDYLTYDVVLACYIAMCFVGCFYLLRTFRMPHDDEDYNQKSLSVGRFMWASVFLSLGLYLFPGMFWAPNGQKHRPAGEIFAFIDAFLLQGDDTRPLPMAGLAGSTAELKWLGFLNEALADAKVKKRRIFIDFTGVNCQNCAKNEKTIFSQADVKAAFESYTLLKLYTDSVPQEYYPVDKLDAITGVERENDGDTNRLFEKQRFNTTELPFYVVIEPTDKDYKEVGRYSIGLIRDKEEFLKFLRDNKGKK